MASVSGAGLPPISKYKISRRGRKLQVTDDQRTLVALPKDVPERTWAEVLQKEENDLFIFELREDIVEEATRIGYERYMEKQNALFTAHCAAQAWLKLIDCVNMWSGVLDGELIGPFELPSRLDGATYKEFLENQQPLLLLDVNLALRRDMVFQNDGAPCHYARLVRNYLNETYPNRQFYRHDPGEDPTAYPPCYIPKRLESWQPDQLPDPSPKDTWCKQELNVVEDTPDEVLQKWPSTNSLDVPVVEEIPSEYWFPGKINVPEDMKRKYVRQEALEGGGSTTPSEEELAAESEVLQKVTDYSTEELSAKDSAYSALTMTSPVDGSLHGAGDSVVGPLRPKRRQSEKSKVFSRGSMQGRSRGVLLPLLDSRSRISIISDCRLRNLRLDTQYEISSEKIVTPPGETVKRK